MIQTVKWIKDNVMVVLLITIILVMGGYIVYDKLFKEKVDSTPLVIDPNTTTKILDNGQIANVKVDTPLVDNPYQAGFSKTFIKDTITGILKVKEKEIKSLTRMKGTYLDSLRLVKTELDSKNKTISYYESKNSVGKVIGVNKVYQDSISTYSADIDLVSVVKRGKVDSLIFYDPNQKITIGGSKEFKLAVPKSSRWKITTTVGFGFVVPLKTKEISPGFFGGIGASYTFK